MATLKIDAGQTGTPISPDLFGIFFEDLNYAADGGLYAELIQNRSFEYDATEQPTWNALSFWELTKRGGGEGSWAVDIGRPIHPNNPHYLHLDVLLVGAGVGLVNSGFDGIPVKAGKSYNVSFFARQRYMNKPWGDNSLEGRPMPVTVRLESKDGEVLAEASFEVTGPEWARFTATIVAGRSEGDARFVLLANAIGGIALDEISLFPTETFRSRPNGLRADLAQVIADLFPRFIRFPGGCLVHGNGTNNFYRWQDTIGPVEQRRGQRNLWGYHQSAGLGYFEFFQFCEDIGAKPLPVVPAGVCCQNADRTPSMGQRCVPMEEMPIYIQEVLDLIEWATGPAASKWGAKRAEAGHPAPFQLEYLAIGNEDQITPGFKERFQMIYEAVRAQHPEITVIGTVGPAPSGFDYEEGWKLAHELKVPIVDEHYYVKPDWFWTHLNRYDAYDRSKSKVYLGEYAAHDDERLTTLRSALAEAAYMTSLERNGDVVTLASYAPLLGKRNRTQWNPDLIYFTNSEVFPTVNYYVQQLFGQNAGDSYLTAQLDRSFAPEDRFAYSVVRDSQSGDLILKLVNGDFAPRQLRIEFSGAKGTFEASKTVLSDANPMFVNTYDTPKPLIPERESITLGETFDYLTPPNSFTVIRIHSS